MPRFVNAGWRKITVETERLFALYNCNRLRKWCAPPKVALLITLETLRFVLRLECHRGVRADSLRRKLPNMQANIEDRFSNIPESSNAYRSRELSTLCSP